MAGMLQLILFGEFSAAGADGNEFAVKSKKARALLAYLALSPRLSRSREEIMALLWSDRGEAQARASLRQVLVGLRKDLSKEAVGALIITNDAVALDPDRVTIKPASPGEELLSGFHLHDPAFEDWLRDERLRHEAAPAPEAQPGERPLADKPSIVVLPFTNLSGDPEQDFFVDGIVDDITTALTRFRSLAVIASSTSFFYKHQRPEIQELGRDLAVAYALEGSLRKAGTRIRITVQLVETETGRHIWAERYDRELGDIFAVQDEIVASIASTLVGQIDESVRRKLLDKRDEDLRAYDFLLLGEQCLAEGAKEDVLRSREYFEKALAIDPGSARAHAGLARSFTAEMYADWCSTPQQAGAQALSLAQVAVALDEQDCFAHLALADVHLSVLGNFAQAEVEIQKAEALNPYWYETLCRRTWLLAMTGQAEEGIACAKMASRLNPFAGYDCRVGHFVAAYTAHRYQDALDALRSISAPGSLVVGLMGACLAQLGQDREARNAATEYLTQASEEIAAFPDHDRQAWQSYWARQFPFEKRADLDHLLEGLRKAGLPT